MKKIMQAHAQTLYAKHSCIKMGIVALLSCFLIGATLYAPTAMAQSKSTQQKNASAGDKNNADDKKSEHVDAKEPIIIAGGIPFSPSNAMANTMCFYWGAHPLADRRCLVSPTSNSQANLALLRSGQADFAIVQSDWQYHAYRGMSRFKQIGADSALRSVMSFYGRVVTVAVRANSPIDSLEKLKGTRINRGEDQSYADLMTKAILDASKIDLDDVSIYKQRTGVALRQLCEQKIDAVITFSVHPNPQLSAAMETCDIKLLPITVSGHITRYYPGYVKQTIPPALYRGQLSSIASVGVMETLVTTRYTDDSLVRNMTRSIMNRLEDIRLLSPLMVRANAADMAKYGLTAPLHEGARRFYSEQGYR